MSDLNMTFVCTFFSFCSIFLLFSRLHLRMSKMNSKIGDIFMITQMQLECTYKWEFHLNCGSHLCHTHYHYLIRQHKYNRFFSLSCSTDFSSMCNGVACGNIEMIFMVELENGIFIFNSRKREANSSIFTTIIVKKENEYMF